MWWANIVSLSLLLITTSSVAAKGLLVTNCSQFQQTVNPVGVSFGFAPIIGHDAAANVSVSFTSILDNDIGPNGYLRVRLVYEGQAWLGFGISVYGWRMTPGFSVIGVPAMANGPTNPGKYEMPYYSVSLLDNSRQTLQDASIIQNSTHTTLTFTKRMQENGEYQIHGNGTNRFLYAVGSDNTLSRHEFQGSFEVTLRACIDGAPIVPTPSPSWYPSYAPFDPSIPYTGTPTATVTTLPPGESHSPSVAYTNSPSLGLFNSSLSSSSSSQPTLSPTTTTTTTNAPVIATTSMAPSDRPTIQKTGNLTSVPSSPPTSFKSDTSNPTTTPATKPTITPISKLTITPTSWRLHHGSKGPMIKDGRKWEEKRGEREKKGKKMKQGKRK